MQCVINGCNKEGTTRIIYSPDQNYGWVCKEHDNELYVNQFPDLEGKGYNLKIGGMKNCQVACGNCHFGAPCNVCHYQKIEDSNISIFEELEITRTSDFRQELTEFHKRWGL